MADIRSKWYPYNNVYPGYYDLSQTVYIPKKIINYILDMPDGDYEPIDDNTYPRTRLWKYLYYDGSNPEDNTLPTPDQKMSVLFDPDNPTNPPDSEKGYRLMPLPYVTQSQTEAQTQLFVYLGNTIADNDITFQMSVHFDIWTHYTEETSMKTDALSRTIAIEQAIMEAFHGIAMAGIGTFYFNRRKNSECGSRVYKSKDGELLRRLVMGIEISSETKNSEMRYNEVSFSGGFMG